MLVFDDGTARGDLGIAERAGDVVHGARGNANCAKPL